MVTTRLLRAVKNYGGGLSASEIDEWVNYISFAVTSGTLLLGEYNKSLINKIYLAWCSKPFKTVTTYEYTHGELPMSVLNKGLFLKRIKNAEYYIKLPLGHPLKAIYRNGDIEKVFALTLPGEYTLDVTEAFAKLFPAGVDKKITSIYAVFSASEPKWAKEIQRIGMLLFGKRGFIPGIDQLTLSWVDGCDIQEFCDYGVLGNLIVPMIEMVNSEINATFNERCTYIAIGNDWRCAFYCSGARTGRIVSMRAVSGGIDTDFICLDLDTGDSILVLDLLSIREKSESSDIHYINDMICDEYGNILLGSDTEMFT